MNNGAVCEVFVPSPPLFWVVRQFSFPEKPGEFIVDMKESQKRSALPAVCQEKVGTTGCQPVAGAFIQSNLLRSHQQAGSLLYRYLLFLGALPCQENLHQACGLC